ncbi:MAG: hypothetical protein WAM14_04650 [Candidatus Nitrosopolaris sp.]
MADWRKIGVQAISSILASGLILTGFNIFYTDFYNKPHINPEWDFTKDASSATITIKNNGRVAATHMILTFQTPDNMAKNSPYVFHTVNVTKSEKINSRLLQINVPSFPTGDGSTIRVVIWLVAKPIGYPNYVFYATYDQGSIKIITEKPLTWGEAFVNFWNTYWIPIILIASGIIVLWYVVLRPSFWIFLNLYLRFPRFAALLFSLNKEAQDYKSASDILSDILIVRNRLRQQPLWNEDFFLDSNNTTLDSKWDSTNLKSKLQLVNNNTQDYFDIDNFFEKIKNREKFVFLDTLDPEPGLGAPIQSVIYDDDLRKINKEVFDICEHCLFAIDWTKYKCK